MDSTVSYESIFTAGELMLSADICLSTVPSTPDSRISVTPLPFSDDDRAYSSLASLSALPDRIMDVAGNLIFSDLCEPYEVIQYHGQLVGFRLPRKLTPSQCERIRSWHSGWHGTLIQNVESIMRYGLRAPGTVLPDGRVIRVAPNHVQLGVYTNSVDNWAQGIFLAPSIIYATMDHFVRWDRQEGLGDWRVIINGRCDPSVATAHAESALKTYTPLDGEPLIRKWRVGCEGDRLDIEQKESVERSASSSHVSCVVTGALVVSHEFLEWAQRSLTFAELQSILDREV